jgi:hypothetical protein
MMRILMVTPQRPGPGHPGTLAPTVRQIESIRALGVDVQVLDVRGVKRLKYLQRLPDLRSLEGSPNVVKEAMACNLPVASVPGGDVSALLAGVHGCAICARDVGEPSVALANVLRRAEPTNGRTAVERKKLDLTGVANKVVDVDVDVLARKRTCAA